MLGLPIEVRPSHIAEVRGPDEPPRAYAERLAREKAASVPGPLVLGADTTVVVVTAIALKTPDRMLGATDVTSVTFRPADDEILRAYVATGEPMDKAGAYGIQGYGAALVERIDGDFFGVMGLPVRLVLDLLARAGYPYRFGRD
jgi:septum formation protein